jgi:acid phosphatase (class A)
MIPRLRFLAAAVLLANAAVANEPAKPVVQSRLGAGYLKPPAMPDALLLIGPPPAEGSKALARDHAGEVKALALQGSPRWQLAISDADLFTPKATASFSCAAGFVIGPAETPKIDAIMRKVSSDFGMSTYPVKNKYKRPRPFVANGKRVCTPEYENILRNDGSYPSGHSAIGYGWAMVLGEIVPNRRGKLLSRGAAFADSRRVCNVHFKSDVEAGGVVAKSVFNALLSDPAFIADLAAAKAEAKALKRVKPECSAENAALKLTR